MSGDPGFVVRKNVCVKMCVRQQEAGAAMIGSFNSYHHAVFFFSTMGLDSLF